MVGPIYRHSPCIHMLRNLRVTKRSRLAERSVQTPYDDGTTVTLLSTRLTPPVDNAVLYAFSATALLLTIPDRTSYA
ncbi:MAG: hypothetical protein ACI9XZ_004264 [Alphaproteobacteria bacterium]|jgi:hypothetical protein